MAWKSVENTGGLMAEGDYEVICLKAEEGETKGGTPCVAFEFQVRSDVEQKYQRKHIFRNFYRDVESGEWPVDRIGKYANSLGIPKGESFELTDLVGRCCLVHMRPYKGNDGVERDSIAWTGASKAAPFSASLDESPAEVTAETQKSGFVPVEDEDLPF